MSDHHHQQQQFQLCLPVSVQPGNGDIVEVPLGADTTAKDVVDFCTKGETDSWWILVADLNGFEKRFSENERLYQLIRKHVLLAGNTDGVRFYLRRKKKRMSICSLLQLDEPVSPPHPSNARPRTVIMLSPESPSPQHAKLRLISATDLESTCSTLPHRPSSHPPQHQRFSSASYDLKMPQQQPLRQPIRVPQPPPQQQPQQVISPTVRQSATSGQQQTASPAQMSYSELVQLAERQRRQMDANRAQMQQKEARIRLVRQDRVTPQQQQMMSTTRVKSLRQDVAVEEAELNRLRHIQSEVNRQQQSNNGAKVELDRLQQIFASKEMELRDAVVKVETLRDQLDQLQKRRQSAASAAAAMATRARDQHLADQRTVLAQKQNELRNVDLRIEQLIGHLRPVNEDRPKAAIEPFKVNQQKQVSPPQQQRKGVNVPISPNKGLPTLIGAVTETLTSAEQRNKTPSPLQTALDYPDGHPKPPVKQVPTTYVASHPQRTAVTPPNEPPPPAPRESPSPPRDPAPSDSSASSAAQARAQRSINMRFNMQQIWEDAKVLENEAPPPDLIPPSDRINQQPQQKQPSLTVSNKDGGASYHHQQHIDADKLTIRNDTLRAAKRRSWAQDGASHDEAEYIRRVLRDEQLKGRSHINFGFIFHELQHSQHPPNAQLSGALNAIGSHTLAQQQQQQSQQSATAQQQSADAIRPPPPYMGMPPPPYNQAAKTGGSKVMDTSTDSSASEEPSSPKPSQLATIDAETLKLIKPTPEKGILKATLSPTKRPPGEKRNIEFDPLALLLDAALEGELDLVQRSAAKITDVSVCNDEGITALHNAICAGHYEIVRFLVESNADVNAQDSDGWTPLHCAASCNNLPMVKFLVERGACVFATTVSDHETPADKCEEDEDGYDGCSQFLIGVQENMGRAGDGKVYAAYSYSAVNDDELNFEDGDALKVQSRDGEEKAWWWCVHEATGKEGFVPRNFLALYPRLAIQRKNNLDIIEVPLPAPVDGQQQFADLSNPSISNLDVSALNLSSTNAANFVTEIACE